MQSSLRSQLPSCRQLVLGLLMGIVLFSFQRASCQTAPVTGRPVKVAVVGLVHDHIAGFLPQLPRHHDVELVGIVETNSALIAKYERNFHLDPRLIFSSIDAMITQQHPDAILVYTSIADHRKVIEAAARNGVNVMVEKPLATNLADAIAIRRTAREHHIQVLVNYETTWYASNREAFEQLHHGRLGDVRRVVIHDGHKGPKEIGVSPEFLKWLTDPQQNGAGALFDFGCYGADLMTWLMGGHAPLSVTAITQTDKPEVYPHVDDEATVILKYPKAQAVIQASWNWPFDRKDMEVYGATGYAMTVGPDRMRLRFAGEAQESQSAAPPLASPQDNSLDYLVAVLRGQVNPNGSLTGLDTNLVVMQILDAARESARTGKTIQLTPLPE
ncbi:MAG TPA: Gfo/Idh/MocA family oxidoreductase [Acidisarcina sp.]|nr:Gfo/Idh/MocA family oxidoreductase [Acidisarcina sp.]